MNEKDKLKALLILTLRDLVMYDTSLSISRVVHHIKNVYNIDITEELLQNEIEDAKKLIAKNKK